MEASNVDCKMIFSLLSSPETLQFHFAKDYRKDNVPSLGIYIRGKSTFTSLLHFMKQKLMSV